MTQMPPGVMLQRDGSFAIMTRNPAGIITPEELERIAVVGRKFHVPYLKITSGQRIILAGIKPEDVSRVFADLGPLANPESRTGVKFVQACLGTEMCRYGSQDSIGLARMVEEKVKDRRSLPKSRLGSPDVSDAVVRASSVISVSSRPSGDGWSSLGGMAGQNPGLEIF